MKKRTLVCFGLLALLVVLGTAAQVVPVAVSPGKTRGVSVVNELCPTFSWTSVDWAVGYRVAVFDALGVGVVSYEQMASAGTEPVLTREIEGRGLSWTPSSEEGLRTGGMYVWYVEAMSPSGPGVWSAGRVFIVDAGAIGSGTEERVTRVLREKGIREEVITDVVKEMKSGVTGAVAGEVVTKPRGDVRAMGFEGTDNTFYGSGAGASITSGINNTFIGNGAGNANTTANWNTFLGAGAGMANVTAVNNTFVGAGSGQTNTTGYSNSFLGTASGYLNTTGYENTYVGRNAGYSNTEGYENTFLGYHVGYSNTTGYRNIFLGGWAGNTNTTGHDNTFVGLVAGTSNTTGSDNTFLGRSAGYSNTTGYQNTFVGRNAGALNSSGTENTCLGYYAGYSNATGFQNTFLGDSAGYSNTDGVYNAFIGWHAGYSNTTGQENAFFGNSAGLSNTTGNYNTFFGHRAGYSNTTGPYNTFIGRYAGNWNTTGASNTFLGHAAGDFNTTGYSNTFLGDRAGITNTTGNHNTFLGFLAGYFNTTGNQNTFLGDDAGYSNTSGNGNIFLGYQAGYNETGSNKFYIDNSNTSSPLIYGEFDNDIVAVNGKFSVGTKAPTYPMELKTTGRNATFVLQRDDGGAINFVNATPAYGQFGTGNNYPVRILVNQSWRMSLNTDNSLTMLSGATCTTGGVWANASSRDLKEGIEALSAAEANTALAELEPVKYAYKADNAERHVGFIAEDVPALVASKDRKTISPMDVVGVLTKVVQEQQKALQEQQKMISEMKERMAELEKKGKLEK